MVFALAGRRGRIEPITLLLVGVIVNSICGSLFILVNVLYPELTAATGGMLSFLVGGIQTNLGTGQIVAAGVCTAAGWLVLLFISGELNVALLGETEARALGVSIHRLRWIALIAASIVTAAAVAVSGPIGFVGLICPHLARLLVGHDQRRLFPIATARRIAPRDRRRGDENPLQFTMGSDAAAGGRIDGVAGWAVFPIPPFSGAARCSELI